MPRAMRETPMAMPTGIAVRQARKNAVKTLNIDHPKWVASGASVRSPRADSHKRRSTGSGVGRNSGGIQPRWLATHHRAKIESMGTTAIEVLRPSPGVEYPDVFGRAPSRVSGLAFSSPPLDAAVTCSLALIGYPPP